MQMNLKRLKRLKSLKSLAGIILTAAVMFSLGSVALDGVRAEAVTKKKVKSVQSKAKISSISRRKLYPLKGQRQKIVISKNKAKGKIRVRITNSKKKVILTLCSEKKKNRVFYWDGKNKESDYCKSGTYYVKLSCGKTVKYRSFKVVTDLKNVSTKAYTMNLTENFKICDLFAGSYLIQNTKDLNGIYSIGQIKTKQKAAEKCEEVREIFSGKEGVTAVVEDVVIYGKSAKRLKLDISTVAQEDMGFAHSETYYLNHKSCLLEIDITTIKEVENFNKVAEPFLKCITLKV